jgi:predicted O-methyltransferase YrrM
MDITVKTVLDELSARIAGEMAQMRAGSFDVNAMALAAGPDTGGLLNLLVRVSGARSIVEIGTSIGYTALWLGEAAKATGGKVVGMEAVADKHRQAVDNLRRAGLNATVEVRLGDAKKIVRDLPTGIDLVFLDAWKDDYVEYFDAVLPKLRIGGAVVADNITRPESAQEAMKRYQAHVRGKPDVRSHFLSIGSGLEMSVRVA